DLPGRWLTGVSATSAKRAAMPFGAGPRLCPGRYLAMLEMKMMMAMLLSQFEIQTVTTPDGGEAKEHLAFTMSPIGLKLLLKNGV
ncbi:MAG TPA: cytochrome P450, partial [Burkholderiales bacterium]|nr:cytochrome P450 [Burkholderiales bacterium]